MSLAALDCQEGPDGVSLKVKVQPRASKNALVGLIGDSLKLALTSPPVEGAANEACAEFFARLGGVPKSRVTIVSGLKSRDKVVRIAGRNKAELLAALAAYFSV